MPTVSVTQLLPIQSNRIWATISAGDGLEKWLPVITHCRLEGSGAGATRFCTMANGAQLRERIVEVDNHARRFRYIIDDHPLPAKNLMGTVEVRALSTDSTEVTWSASFEAEEPHATELQGMFREIYTGAIEGLGKHLSTS